MIKKTLLQESLERSFSNVFDNKIKVSIHSKASLDNMSILDAQLLVLGEYIVMYRKNVQSKKIPRDYFIAKSILLLLRNRRNETYGEVNSRLNKNSINTCFLIKIGHIHAFPSQIIQTIMQDFADHKRLMYFLEHAYFNDPDYEYESTVLNKLYKAETIDKWLKDYFHSKMLNL